MPKPEPSNHPYMQIADSIRGQITSRELAPGTALPALRALASEWGVSQVTVSKAIKVLEEEGYVQIGGSGLRTLVLDQHSVHRNGKDRANTVRRTGRIYTAGEYARVTSAEIVPAPPEVAAALGLTGPEPKAIRRVRVTFNGDDKPVSASTSWLDAALAEQAPKLLETSRIVQGSWGYVEERTGLRAAHGRDQISSRLATEEDAALLGLELPAAVKVSTTLLWTDDGVSIEYGVSVSEGGRESSYEYELAPTPAAEGK